MTGVATGMGRTSDGPGASLPGAPSDRTVADQNKPLRAAKARSGLSVCHERPEAASSAASVFKTGMPPRDLI